MFPSRTKTPTSRLMPQDSKATLGDMLSLDGIIKPTDPSPLLIPHTDSSVPYLSKALLGPLRGWIDGDSGSGPLDTLQTTDAVRRGTIQPHKESQPHHAGLSSMR